MIELLEIKSEVFEDYELAKSYIRDDDVSNEIIQLLVKSATDVVEAYLGFNLRKVRYKQFSEEREFDLLQMYPEEIISVKDETGNDVGYTLMGNNTVIRAEQGRVFVIFETNEQVLRDVYKRAILLQAGYMHENRGDELVHPQVLQELNGYRINIMT